MEIKDEYNEFAKDLAEARRFIQVKTDRTGKRGVAVLYHNDAEQTASNDH